MPKVVHLEGFFCTFGSDSGAPEATLRPIAEATGRFYDTTCVHLRLSLSSTSLTVRAVHPGRERGHDASVWLLAVARMLDCNILFLALRVDGDAEVTWARKGGSGGPWEQYTVAQVQL